MNIRPCSGWRLPLTLIATTLLCGPRLAAAATLSIETLLAERRLDGIQVDYNPGLEALFVSFDNPNSTLSDTDLTVVPETHDVRNSPQSALFLNDEDYGDVLRIAFNTFGSLQAVLGASSGNLLRSSALMMGGNNLRFIVDTNSVAGPLASRYRDANIYMTVAGLDAQDWLRGYDPSSRARYDFLSAAEDVANAGLAPAVPVPTTLLLFLAASIPLLLTRRRG